MKALGGYLELELARGDEYHASLIALNTGRNALEYILRANAFKKVYLPLHTCDAVFEAAERAGMEHALYPLDKHLHPVFDLGMVEDDAAFLYTNYFGVCDAQVAEVAAQCKNVIVDNAQAFYCIPPEATHAFYSARKFFGVPDGAYARTNATLDITLEQDRSFDRCAHLLQRHDEGPEKGYAAYQIAEATLQGQPVRTMSRLTKAMMRAIDYASVAQRRRSNFTLLHNALGASNRLQLSMADSAVPMVYPYWMDDPGTRQRLLEARIYTAQYWPNVVATAGQGSLEHDLASNLIALPVDQRLMPDDLQRIIDLI